MKALFRDPMVMSSITSEQAVPIAKRAIDDVSEPVVESTEPQTCTDELMLYWKNSGMPDQEILSRCNSVKQP